MFKQSKKIMLIMIFVAGICSAGCADSVQIEDKAPLVKTVIAEMSSTAQDYTYSGTVCSRYETNLAFQVGGRILSRNVQVGSIVRVGDVLMVIDNRDVLQQTNQGEAQVAAAKAQLDLAQSNLNRYRQLYEANAISAATLDQYQTAYDSAFASYQNAIAQAQQAYNELTYTDLTANANGIISAVNAEQGQVVAAGQTVMTLAQTDELEVEINVPESRMQDVEIGKPVAIAFWALNSETTGNVREISPVADTSSRTYRIRVTIPQPPANVQLGMTVNAVLTSNIDTNAIVLPISAIFQTDDKAQVWVVKDNKVSLKTVTVANFDNNNIAVQGLHAGDVVVSAGVHQLREGQTVRTD